MSTRRRSANGERLVAVFEGGKGLLVLLLGFGLLSVVHRDIQWVAGELITTLHLNAANRVPRIFLDLADRFADVRLWLLAALALTYSIVRLAEAYGLWWGHRWAEWLAVASGAIYVPLEIYELFHRVSWVKVSALIANVGIVAYIGWALWQRRQAENLAVAIEPQGD